VYFGKIAVFHNFRYCASLSKIMKNYDFVEIGNYALKNGVPKAADHFGFDEPLVWAILGREKNDQSRRRRD